MLDWTPGQVPPTKPRSQVQRESRLSGGRQSNRRAKRAQSERDWLARPFVAWDGEGVTRADGSHDYLLLAVRRPDGSSARISSLDHLTTEQIFDFALKHGGESGINVIYGAGYDFNMWLSDLTEEQLRTLYDTGRLYWHGYTIKWRRGKSLHLKRRSRTALFYDVISFFQMPFVKACDSYLGERFEDRELIAENKRLRSGFRADDLTEITRYNDAELRNLINLMIEFRERLYRAGLKPGRWDGPGALAVALMQRHDIKSHMMPTPDEIGTAVRCGYFGGRFEVRRFGHVEQGAWEYDLNSAYPRALLEVPSLAGGRWDYAAGDPGDCDFAIYDVTYDDRPRMNRPGPFPVRHGDGSVSYPLHARGWYWTPEIRTARRYTKVCGGTLTFHGAWVFTPAHNDKPFAYLAEVYEERRTLKARKDGAHVGLKLAMNSHYGKLAQQVGWHIDHDGKLQIPPYHQLEWAGFTTSWCRAAVLEAVLPVIDHVIAWETDAVFVDKRLSLDEGSGLGQWETTSFTDLTYLQSGTYFANGADGPVAKTRGVDRGTVTRELVLAALERGEDHLSATLTRFTGVGLALQSRFAHWRRWETVPKNLALFPHGKTIHVGCDACNGNSLSIGRWHSTLTAPLDGYISSEYPVGWINPNPDMSQLDELRSAAYEGWRYED